MNILYKHKHDFLKDIVECPICRSKEYYGFSVMRDGLNHCRKCIYNVWEKESYEEAKRRESERALKYGKSPNYENLNYWKPNKDDELFPMYHGEDYFNNHRSEYYE